MRQDELTRFLAEALSTEMRERGITTHELAALSGVDRKRIRAYENGRGTPSSYNLYRIAKGLGVEVSRFFPRTLPEVVHLENAETHYTWWTPPPTSYPTPEGESLSFAPAQPLGVSTWAGTVCGKCGLSLCTQGPEHALGRDAVFHKYCKRLSCTNEKQQIVQSVRRGSAFVWASFGANLFNAYEAIRELALSPSTSGVVVATTGKGLLVTARPLFEVLRNSDLHFDRYGRWVRALY